MNNIYIIKSLAPWMIDELLVFSSLTNYSIYFLREQKEFYANDLKQLERNGVKIYYYSITLNELRKKLYVIIDFFRQNISSFKFDYNLIVGLKSIFWFLTLDLTKFTRNCSMHAQFATQAALIALLVKRFYNNEPKYSFTFHAYDIYFNNRWFALLVRNSQNAFSISEFNLNYVKRKFDISNNLKLTRLGVFTDRFNKKKKSREKSKEAFTIGLISWFVQKKGIRYLLEAMSEIKKKGYPIKLILAGDGPLKNEFLGFINSNQLNDVVELSGKIQGEEKQDFFDSIDVFVLPSISLENDQDGIPVVLMEAVAASLPLISTNISGIPEICFNGYNGILIEEKSVVDLEKAIIFMFENENERSVFGQNSLSVSSNYDIVANSKDKIEILGWNNIEFNQS